MTEHITSDDLFRLRSGAFAPADALRVLEHRAVCSACRALEPSPGDTEVLRALLDFDICPARSEDGEQQLVDFVLGRGDAGLSAHVESCPDCSAIVTELRRDRTPIPISTRSRPIWRRVAIAALLAVVVGAAAWSIVHHEKPVPAADRINDGGMELALNSGEWMGVTLPDSADRNLVLATLQSGRLPAARRQLPGVTGSVLRGDAPAAPGFGLLDPVARRVVPARPFFSWSALADATSYRVAVFSMDMQVLAESPLLPATQTSWEPSGDLPRGVRLGWQVTAQRRGHDPVLAPAPPLPPAYFELVSAEGEQRLAHARSANPPSHLLLASLYASEGMPAEARSELEALAAANPRSTLARNLLVMNRQ